MIFSCVKAASGIEHRFLCVDGKLVLVLRFVSQGDLVCGKLSGVFEGSVW